MFRIMLRCVNIFLFIPISLILTCCISDFSKKTINEGIIEYKIDYFENEMEDMSTHLLPQKLFLVFNDKYAKTTLQGFMGMFSLEIITDFKDNTNTTLIKVFDNKYVHYGEKYEYSSLFNHMHELEIEFTSDTGQICGFMTKIVRLNSFVIDNKPIEIHYSPEIGSKNPNQDNPFHEIDGVLLFFPIRLSNIKLVARAVSIKQMEIDEKQFKVPESYSSIGRKNMDRIIEELLKK